MRLTVGDDSAGERLDVVLAGPLGSRARAARLIGAGAVTVDGAIVQKRFALKGGEVIEVDEALDPHAVVTEGPESEPAPFAIAYEDEHLLVIDKPAGVVVHPARGHRQGTLAQALAGKARGGEEGYRAGIVHRLDRDTSGLLVVAKSDEVHRALKALLQRREITREYAALVDGRPPSRSGTIEAPIGRDRKVRTKMSTDTADGRDAITHFEVVEALATTTLLRVRLQTGRTHQIRVHLQAIGFPVCGDPDYGRAGAFGLARQFLHAQRLAFAHPLTGDLLDVESPLPADLAAALELARG